MVRDSTCSALQGYIRRHAPGSPAFVFRYRHLQRAAEEGRWTKCFVDIPGSESAWSSKWAHKSLVGRRADLAQYAEDERFPCNDPAEAERIFQKHRIFLLMCFLKRTHGIGWSNTPLYQTFRRHFPVGQHVLQKHNTDPSIERLRDM